MDPRTPPAPSESDGPPRRPRHRWSFERLEDRTLLATGPAVATPAQLSAARPITGGASGFIASGESDFFRVNAATDELLIAQAHADGARTRLSLLDAQGHLLTQSDGLSAANPDDLIAQHIGQGMFYLELTGTGGIGPFALTNQAPASSTPGSAITNINNIYINKFVNGDFNGDGRLDIAAATYNEVLVLLSNGDGTFQSPVNYAVGAGAVGGAITSLAVGDFNGDGRLDIAAGYTASHLDYLDPVYNGGVSVLLGDGDGTFQSPLDYAVKGGVTSLAVGDFNGDGRPDIAAGHENINGHIGTFSVSGGVSVLLGGGDGTFRSPLDYAVKGTVTSLAVGDFNGDGRLDIAAGYDTSDFHRLSVSGGVSVLLGDGDGTFRSPVNYPAGGIVTSLAAGDFNGDGRLDIAAGYQESNTGGVSVLLGDGDGTFQRPVSYGPVDNINSLAVGDFNGDGRLDIAAGHRNSGYTGGVSVLLGDGDGRFQRPVNYEPLGTVTSLAVGDFNGDGRVNIAAGYEFDSSTRTGGVSVLLGDGDGTFQSPINDAAVGTVTSLAVGDFNGDGRLDIAAGTSGGVSVLLGNGDGTFQSPINDAAVGTVTSLAVGDFNGDGRLDIAAGTSGGVSVLLGNGDGTFQSPVNYPAGGIVTSLAAGDFNGDGRLDIAAGYLEMGMLNPTGYNGLQTDEFIGGVSMLLGHGDGTFQSPVNYPAGGAVNSLATGDFNGDGRVNIAAGYFYFKYPNSTFVGGISVLLGNGDGTFQRPVNTDALGPVYSLAAGDFNGDGHVDIAAVYFDALRGSFYANGIVLLGSGDGTFQKHFGDFFTSGAEVSSLAVGDFNGDGRLDIAAGYQVYSGNYSGGVLVSLGHGDGTFDRLVGNETGCDAPANYVTSLAVGDFNGDGRPDLVVQFGVTRLPSVLLNSNSDQLSNPNLTSRPVHGNPLLADLSGTGTPDLIVIDQSGDILWRRAIPGQPGSYEPPIVVNPGAPSRDIAIVFSGGRNLIASVNAVANAVVLYAFRSRGFVEVGRLPTGSLPLQVITARLTGDGLEDLVVRNVGDGTASIYLADGIGGFTKMIPDLAIGVGASDIAAADLNGSGRDGLVVTNQVTGDVRVFPNLGHGIFGPPSRYQAGRGPYGLANGAEGIVDLTSREATAGVAVGTFIPGGSAGLAVFNTGSKTLAVLDGLGGGALANARVLPIVAQGSLLRVADLRGHGVTDLVVLGPAGLDVYLGDGRGGFSRTPEHYDVGPDPRGLTVADLNGDGKLDVLIGNQYGDVLVLLGNGDGSFRPFLSADRGIALAVADLNGDGQKDIIYADQSLNRVSIQYGQASPTVLAGKQQGLLAPGAVTLADFTIGGVTSRYLIVANSGGNNVLVYPGLGNGQFGPALNGGHGFFTGTNPVSVTVAYLVTSGPGAGFPDLVVADRGSNDVAILLGQMQDGNLTFVPGPRLKAGVGPASAVVVSLPGEAQPGLLVSDSQANQVRILRGRGQGFFNDQNPTIIPVGVNPGPLFVGNFTGVAGQLDLVTINPGSDSLSFVPNFLSGGVAQSLSTGGSLPVAAIAFGRGGVDNLLVANEGDGILALFLGGPGGLRLAETMTSPDLPNPTALAFDALSGDVLQFYAGTAGIEAATLLQFNLGDEGVAAGGLASPPPSQTAVSQVARLQPLGESSLAIIATLLTTTTELTASESPPVAEVETTAAVAQGTSAALPNQSALPADEEPSPEDESGSDGPDDQTSPVLQPQDALSPLRRFLYRLDEAIEKARRDAREATSGPSRPMGSAERSVRALDTVLARWSPALAATGGTTPALLASLVRAGGGVARAIESPLRTTPTGRASLEPARAFTAPDSTRTAPAITSAVSISLAGVARAVGDSTERSRRRGDRQSGARARPRDAANDVPEAPRVLAGPGRSRTGSAPEQSVGCPPKVGPPEMEVPR